MTDNAYKVRDSLYIRRYRADGFTLHLWDVRQEDRPTNGDTWHTYLHYRLLDQGRIIFEGSDFGIPQGMTTDGLRTVEGILDFLSTGEGDTDDEYFDDYTPEQLTWRDSSRREDLAYIAQRLEERNGRDGE